MRRKHLESEARGVAIVNLQKRYPVNTASLLEFGLSLRRRLPLGKREFNISLVDDHAIRHLNAAYLGKDKATDVLSFPWRESAKPPESRANSLRQEHGGITNFLGDVVISVETARRNAGAEGHSTLNEIRWLVLHGVLHLLGYDHERDSGEMVALELSLREQLEINGSVTARKKRAIRKARRNRQRSTIQLDPNTNLAV